MKAVVVEFKNDLAAVLSDDGCIVTVKNNNYEIGQVIQMSNTKINFTKKIAMFAASAAAFVVLGVGAWAYASPYSYVSVDVNPSIEFTVNRFDRVLRVKAVNDDGEEILKEISLDDLNNKSIEEALTKTVEQLSESGYFDGDIEGGIVITTSAQNPDKAEDLALELQQTAEIEVAELGDDVVVEAYSVTLERVEEAKALGVTPGKLNLVEKLQASSTDPDTIDLNEWLNKSVRDIMKATKDNRKASAVTGSAIIIDTKDDDKAKTSMEKADEKTKKEADKALKKANRDAQKANDDAEKASEKAIIAADKAKVAEVKASEKAREATEKSNKSDKFSVKDKDKAKKASIDADKAAEDAKKAREDSKKATEIAKKATEEAKKANKEADKATEEAEKANKEADKAAKEAEKANKEAGKATKDAEKANKEADKGANLAEKDTNTVPNSGANNNEDFNNDSDSNRDTENTNGNHGNSNSGGKK